MQGEVLRVAISDWIMVHALASATEVEILAGICEQMNRAGLPILRASVAHDLLDPTFDARGVRWQRDQGGLEEAFPRSDDPLQNQDWTRSPFFYLFESHEPMLRRRLDATYRRGEFPMLDRFQDEGTADYIAFISRVGESMRLGEGEGIMASWTTDAREGFSDAQVKLLAGIMPALTLAFMLRTMNRTARTLIQTYLGSDAAERVLAEIGPVDVLINNAAIHYDTFERALSVDWRIAAEAFETNFFAAWRLMKVFAPGMRHGQVPPSPPGFREGRLRRDQSRGRPPPAR